MLGNWCFYRDGANSITVQAVDLGGNPSNQTLSISRPDQDNGTSSVAKKSPGEGITETLAKEKPVTVTVAVMAGNIPSQTTELDGRQYIYSVNFDSDKRPANNWVSQEAFGFDYYQGTDRWYEVIINSDGSVVLKVSQSGGKGHVQQVYSKAYAVITGNTVIFVIPTIEVSADAKYRITAFRHDGSYRPEYSAGDVSGANPKEALSVSKVNIASGKNPSSPGLTIPAKRKLPSLDIPAGPSR